MQRHWTLSKTHIYSCRYRLQQEFWSNSLARMSFDQTHWPQFLRGPSSRLWKYCLSLQNLLWDMSFPPDLSQSKEIKDEILFPQAKKWWAGATFNHYSIFSKTPSSISHKVCGAHKCSKTTGSSEFLSIGTLSLLNLRLRQTTPKQIWMMWSHHLPFSPHTSPQKILQSSAGVSISLDKGKKVVDTAGPIPSPINSGRSIPWTD